MIEMSLLNQSWIHIVCPALPAKDEGTLSGVSGGHCTGRLRARVLDKRAVLCVCVRVKAN